MLANFTIWQLWRHDTQHCDIPHNDTQHKGLIDDIQYYDTANMLNAMIGLLS